MKKSLFLLFLCSFKIVYGQNILFQTSETSVPYRIPAIASLKNGCVVSLADYRICKYDIGNGDIDLHGRISSDYGNTWSDIFEVANGSGVNNCFHCGFGDASIASIGNKILIMCVGGSTIFQQGDSIKHNSIVKINGKYDKKNKTIKFEEPIDVSEMFFNKLFPNAYSMFIASGKITVGKNNRLYCSVLVKHDKTDIYHNYVIYSDNFGDEWKILGNNAPCIIGGDEAKVVELANGQIVISSRKQGGGRYFNVFTYENFKKGIGVWDKQKFCKFKGKNATNGELLVYNDILLQSIPTKDNRSNVSIFYKVVIPKTKYTSKTIVSDWNFGIEVDDGLSSYSTMTILKDGTIGVLYEKDKPTNNRWGCADIVFKKYRITDIILYKK